MTLEQQRICIAEVCGWERCYWNPHLKSQLLGWLNGNWKCVPDYTGDLNAIHAAEWASGPATVKAMRYWLWQICDEMTGHSASAPQRAEALLRTLGRWKEQA